MRNSVIYQEILQEGKEEGKKEEAILFITRLLTWRFGEIDSTFQERIRSLSLEKLENLGVELLDFSEVADLEAWLGYPRA